MEPSQFTITLKASNKTNHNNSKVFKCLGEKIKRDTFIENGELEKKVKETKDE
jgi:hypothetical protein